MEQFAVELLSTSLGISTPAAALVYEAVLWVLATAAGLTVVGYLYLTKTSHDQVTYSGNMFEETAAGHVLQLRTLEVLPRSAILPSNFFFRINLLRAIWRCSTDDPFVRMSHRDMDVLQPAIINGLSRLFSDGLIAKQSGVPMRTRKLFIAVTCEKYDDRRSRKLRVIVLTERELARMLNPAFREHIILERVHHAGRIMTLTKMAEIWKSEKDTPADDMRIVRVVERYESADAA